METKITHNNFKAEVLGSKMPVLIDFYADWCMPCKMLSPVIEELSWEEPHVKVCKVNIDEEPELAGQFQVMSIPTLVVMKDGAITSKAVGVQSKQTILSMLSQ